MEKNLQIFLEYKLKNDMMDEYENEMPAILKEVERLGATEIAWYEAADQKHLYVEMFRLASIDEYNIMKNKRQDENHPVFGVLSKYVEGGMEKVHCWAFIQK